MRMSVSSVHRVAHGESRAQAKLTGKAPNHRRVGNTDRKRYTNGADERDRRIKTRPDHNANVAVDEELWEKQEPLVGLVGVGEGAEDAGHAAVEDGRAVG